MNSDKKFQIYVIWPTNHNTEFEVSLIDSTDHI
jgi:hypothetical protein